MCIDAKDPCFGEQNVALSPCFELVEIFGQVPRFSAGIVRVARYPEMSPSSNFGRTRFAFSRFTLPSYSLRWTFFFPPNFDVVPRALGQRDGAI